MNKPTLLCSIQGKSSDEIRHDAMAMRLVRRIVLDYLPPGGLTANEAMELLLAVVDPYDGRTGSFGPGVGPPRNDNREES